MRIRSRGVARFPLWLVLCLALPSALGAAPQAPAATEEGSAEALPAGEWNGILALEAKPLAAVHLVQLDGKARLLFGSPLNCELLVKPQPGGSYALESVNGGAYCRTLVGKPLRLQRSGDDLRLNVDGKDLPAMLHAGPGPGQPTALNGKWWGSVQVPFGSGRFAAQLLVSITATPLHANSATVQLRYSEPWQCLVYARYVGMHEGMALYSLFVTHGGFCASLSGGQLTLRARPNERVELQIMDIAGRHQQTALLEPAVVNR